MKDGQNLQGTGTRNNEQLFEAAWTLNKEAHYNVVAQISLSLSSDSHNIDDVLTSGGAIGVRGMP